MKHFETHHITIDLNDIDPQSTTQSSKQKEVTKSFQLTPEKTLKNPFMNPKNPPVSISNTNPLKNQPSPCTPKSPFHIISSQKHPMASPKPQNLSESPIKTFIHNTLRDEYTLKNSLKIEESKKEETHYLFQRNFSKESDMWHPVSCNSSEDIDQEEIMENIKAYDNRLNKWLDLAASHDSHQFDIRKQLFRAFGYGTLDTSLKHPQDYYLRKRRNGMNTTQQQLNMSRSQKNSDLGCINSIVHIRQAWDPTNKMTPTSSMKTSEFSKINKYDESDLSSEHTIKESFKQVGIITSIYELYRNRVIFHFTFIILFI